jgi:flagellar biosynthesis anti-sigma factor FlgM
MRIDLNSVSRGAAAEKSDQAVLRNNKTRSENTQTSGDPEDKVSLSSLVQQVLQAPETRQAKVENLRQAVQSGQYSVDPKQIAESILANSPNAK